MHVEVLPAAVYAALMAVMPGERERWRRMLEVEKNHHDMLDACKGIRACGALPSGMLVGDEVLYASTNKRIAGIHREVYVPGITVERALGLVLEMQRTLGEEHFQVMLLLEGDWAVAQRLSPICDEELLHYELVLDIMYEIGIKKPSEAQGIEREEGHWKR